VLLGTAKEIVMTPSQVSRAATKLLLSLIVVGTGAQASFAETANNLAPTTAYNASKSYLGCYLDPKVTILTAAKLSTIAMTPQYCANWCGQRGFAYGGIEFGT
jgi:beta-D-xylosidase 4